MSGELTCGQALVRLLERYGVELVFGIPGVHTLELYRGLANSRIRHVLVRHEQGAGFMADGYARTTDKPGVCFVITGPGVTNIATPMGQAFSDSVPMLVISTVNATSDIGQGYGRLHEITDQAAVTAPLTAFSVTITEPAQIETEIARAFEVFNSARPRPVHIEIPLDIVAAPVPRELAPLELTGSPAVDTGLVADAKQLLENAQQPVIIVGGGARHAGAAIEAIASTLGATLVTTCAGKGIVPDTHPLHLGASLSLAPTREHLGSADVILAIGSELAQTDHYHDTLPLSGKLIRVDIDTGKLHNEYEPTLAIHAEAGAFAQQLTEQLKPGAAAEHATTTSAAVARIRDAIVSNDSPLEQCHRRVLMAMRDTLPADAIVVTDMTQIAYTGLFAFPVDLPERWLHPQGYGTLGYALPAAMGAKLANPETPVAALVGDAGFLFTLPELAPAVDMKLPVITILWNNDALGQIRGDMIAQDIPAIGVEGHNPDFVALGKSFGCHSERVTSLDALRAAISEGMERAGPSLIEVHQSDFEQV